MDVVRADVVVVGSGLAGVSAAVEAAHAGARVALLTSGTLCEGSSFSPHTWGLGMVSPLDERAERSRSPHSLACAMEAVGAHQNRPELVDALMEDAASAPGFLASLGATVTTPDKPGERAYVPCFDTRVRGWRGFHARESRDAVARSVRATEGVRVFEHTRALSLLQPCGPGTPVSGLVAWSGVDGRAEDGGALLRFEAPAVVLATGGLAGLYAHSFGGGPMGAAMAADAGASFANLEFVQLMLAFLSKPYGTICNEKLWRHARVCDERGASVFARAGYTAEQERAALEAHSWHGPFTTARESRLLELAVQAVAAEGGHAYLRLSEEFLDGEHPEFVDTYLAWLRGKGVDPHEPAQIGLFVHSSNGGIAIDAQGATSVEGLFAAGECAGGVHGADRVGGLASVSAVVFGRRAGTAAARLARSQGVPQGGVRLASPFCPVDDAPLVQLRVGELLGRHCLVGRTEEGLLRAARGLEGLQEQHFLPERPLDAHTSPRSALDAFCSRGAVVAARLMVDAMAARHESLGSHHRSD